MMGWDKTIQTRAGDRSIHLKTDQNGTEVKRESPTVWHMNTGNQVGNSRALCYLRLAKML